MHQWQRRWEDAPFLLRSVDKRDLSFFTIFLYKFVQGIQLCCSRHRQYGGAVSLWQQATKEGVA